MNAESIRTPWGQFFSLVSVFFFWGFVAASNDILIPVFKHHFNLSQGESQLVAVAFYVAYTVGALIYLGISKWIKQDVVERIGHKNSLSLGLCISAVGTLLFLPAANLESFYLMLGGLFIVGLGFSLQQTVANPLAVVLGDPKTGSQRLTLAGGLNTFGTTIGPLIVAYAIFGTVSSETSSVDLESVKIPYLCLGLAFLLVAVFLKFSSLPNRIENQQKQEEVFQENTRKSALHYPQLWMGMIAIFVYVGVEVSTASNLPAYMEEELGFRTQDVTPFISLYWASLMIGRWSGAVEAFGLLGWKAKILKWIAPYLAFGVYLMVNAIAGHDLSSMYIYCVVILILILADISSKGNPISMLFIFSIIGAVATIIGMSTEGLLSVYALTSVGLFCSTLWPCIFALAIRGLSKHTTQGSNYLIMMIMGGGIISWLQGVLADKTSIHTSYIVGVLCFGYLAFYAVKVKSILKKQKVSFD